MSNIVNNFLVEVRAKSDLPVPSGGVITLADNVTYLFCGTIDLTGDRLVCGQNTVILGGSSENCRIKSTGLSASTALISSGYSLPIRSIAVEHGTAINLDASATANQALDWFGVNFVDCATVGTVKSYTNFIMQDCAFLNTGAITFDGTIGTIGFSQCIFDAASTKTLIILSSTLTVSRRFRVIYSAFVVASGETGINVSTSASIPVEGYILDTVNFAGGGTYTTGVTYDDNKALFFNCRGVANSGDFAHYYMSANATATTIGVSGVYYKVAGTTSPGSYTEKFSLATTNRATKTGVRVGYYKITAVASLTAGNNQQVSMQIAFNGTGSTESTMTATTSGAGRAENMKCMDVLLLGENDYIEVFVANNTTTANITVESLQVIVERLN